MKYKVGDAVRVKSFEELKKITKIKNDFLYYKERGRVFNIIEMSRYCGKSFKIKKVYNDYYILENNSLAWEDWMLTNNKLELE